MKASVLEQNRLKTKLGSNVKRFFKFHYIFLNSLTKISSKYASLEICYIVCLASHIPYNYECTDNTNADDKISFQ